MFQPLFRILLSLSLFYKFAPMSVINFFSDFLLGCSCKLFPDFCHQLTDNKLKRRLQPFNCLCMSCVRTCKRLELMEKANFLLWILWLYSAAYRLFPRKVQRHHFGKKSPRYSNPKASETLVHYFLHPLHFTRRLAADKKPF